MNTKKLNILIGLATLVIVYGLGILIFQVLSYKGFFFIKKNQKWRHFTPFLRGLPACYL